MIKNIGAIDRSIRFGAAAILILFALFVVSGTLAWVFGLLGLALAATGAVGTCPIYMPFGISTVGEPRHTLRPD